MRTDAGPPLAAWVPNRDDMTWDDAAALAAAWAAQHSTELAAPVLVAKAAQSSYLPEVLARYGSTTFRSRAHPRPRGVVIAYVPDLALLDLALGCARGFAICAIEGSVSLEGWARSAGALNLVDRTIAASVSDEQTRHLQRIELYSNNGFTSGPDRDHVLRILQQMTTDGTFDREVILGHFAARTRSGPRALQRLGQLLDRVERS